MCQAMLRAWRLPAVACTLRLETRPGDSGAGSYDTPGYAYDVVVAGSYAYVADGVSGLEVIEVSNPANTVEVGHCDTPGSSVGLGVAGGYAYVADWNGGLRLVNVSNPASPVEVAYWDTPGNAKSVAGGNGYVYLGSSGWGLMVFPEVPLPGAISGQVRVRGTTTNIAGATVEAYLGGVLKGSGATGSNGIYSVPDLPRAPTSSSPPRPATSPRPRRTSRSLPTRPPTSTSTSTRCA